MTMLALLIAVIAFGVLIDWVIPLLIQALCVVALMAAGIIVLLLVLRALLVERPEPPKDAVLLGTVVGNADDPDADKLAWLTAAERRRHVYLLGATGTGKTNLLLQLIQDDLTRGRSCCVVDLRGDLVERVLLRLAQYETPESLHERCLLVDLRERSWATGFNVLAGEGDPYSRALHVLSVLRQQSESWGVQLEETLRNSLVALAQTGWTLLEIEPLLSDPGFRTQVLSGVEDAYVQAFFRRYGQLSAEKQLVWTLPVLNKVTPLLAHPQMRLLFGQRTALPLRSLLDHDQGSILLVSLAVDQLQEAAYLVGGLFLSAFQASVMARVDTPEGERRQVHLYLDEFETMATERFAAIVAEGRRFGLGLCLSHQNLHQIPPTLRQVLRNNVHTQLLFQTGTLDAADLAREVDCDQRLRSVQKELVSLPVGDAYLVRRGRPSWRVETPYSPDPVVPRPAVQALREAALRRYARPRDEVERELVERHQRIAASGSTQAPQVTYEIRHTGRTHEYRPREAQ